MRISGGAVSGGAAAAGKYAWKHKAIVTSSFSAVLNTWYTMLDETGGVELRRFNMSHHDDEEGNRIVQVKITVDGVVYESVNDISARLAFDTVMGWRIEELNYAANAWTSTIEKVNDPQEMMLGRNYLEAPTYLPALYTLFGHSIKVEVRMTEVGTNQILRVGLRYNKLEAVV